MVRLQGGSKLVRHEPAAGDVDHRRQINEPMRHRNIGGVERPNLVGCRDRTMPEQIGIERPLHNRTKIISSRL